MKCSFIIIVLTISDIVPIALLQDDTCVAETNEQRAKRNLNPLKVNQKLLLAAKTHNDWMVSNNCFKHECPGEPNLIGRVKQTGYQWKAIAENTRAGKDKNCQEVMQNWLKTNVSSDRLFRQFTDMGCSAAKCDVCTYKAYYTCVYGRPKK